jgi:acetyl-CoA carboxylase carboxyltransferase component
MHGEDAGGCSLLAARLGAALFDRHHVRVLAPWDPPDRLSTAAGSIVPEAPRASYDVRDVIRDLVDDADFVELQATYGASLCIGLARVGGQSIGVVANQPCQLAGALDIDSSLKGARFVRWCDSFNLPLLTLVDTPGFRPGRDQEWQGIVRHGAKLAYAYAEATVPRVSVVLRKAYGGAYIVMDCKSMGSDCTLAWSGSEIAVMGAQGAVEILNRRELAAEPDDEQRAARREKLEADYAAEHLSPRAALERGFVDAVVEPEATRPVLTAAFSALVNKQRTRPERRHDNIPL